MKIKYILLAALVIALVITFFVWDDINVTEISAQQLSSEYSKNAPAADTKYLNKMLKIDGNVKAYYKILGARPVLELETGTNLPMFFFFLSQENESYAGQLQLGQHVVIKGKCVGEKEYSFVNGIKIEVEKFIEK